jgi:hypothetical protein
VVKGEARIANYPAISKGVEINILEGGNRYLMVPTCYPQNTTRVVFFIPAIRHYTRHVSSSMMIRVSLNVRRMSTNGTLIQ